MTRNGQRMQEAKKENFKRNTSNIYSVDALFYRLKDEKKAKELKTVFKDSKGRPFVVLWNDPNMLNVKSSTYIEDIVGKRVFRTERDTVRLFLSCLILYKATEKQGMSQNSIRTTLIVLDCSV